MNSLPWRAAACVSAVVAGAALSTPAASAGASQVVTAQALEDRVNDVTRPVQARIDDQLKLTPQAVQISSTEVAFAGGRAVMTFPLQGRRTSPASTRTALDLMDRRAGRTASRRLAQGGPTGPVASAINGCPTQIIGADYYCLYEHRDFGGRRLQWNLSHPTPVYLGDYGFNNQASSWVNGGGLRIYVRDHDRGYQIQLWSETGHTKSTYVGNTSNDRADSFTTS